MIPTKQPENRQLIARECPDLESSSEGYALRFAGPVGEYFLGVQRDIVLSMLPPTKNCRVLDVGGGHAQLTPALVEQGYDVTVFGSDDSCINRLDRLVGSKRYDFVEGNLLDLPFASNVFDVVLAFRLLPHLQSWRAFIAELCRVAKRCVILDYPTLQSFNKFSGSLFSLKQRVEKTARPYRCFHDQLVEKSFQKSEFRIEQKQPQFFLPMAFHRLGGNSRLSRSLEALAKSLGATSHFGSPVILKTVPIHH